MIRSIEDKRSKNPVFHLQKKDGTKAETEQEIVETLADNYEEQSSSQKHSDKFRNTKTNSEKKPLNFKSDNKENILYERLEEIHQESQELHRGRGQHSL